MTDTDNGGKATPKGSLPPYIAFKSLIDIIERMQNEGVPTRVDGTWLESYAGGYRPTVIANLHVMGLLGKDGVPTETMLDLVEATESERKDRLALVIGDVYSDILALPRNSTQGEFLAAFSARGANGDTRRKAISFFLKACAYAGVQTGGLWKTPPASASGSVKRRPAANKNTPAIEEPPAQQATDDPSAETVIVSLGEAGSVTVSVAVKWLMLDITTFTKLRTIISDLQALTPPEGGESETDEIDEIDPSEL